MDVLSPIISGITTIIYREVGYLFHYISELENLRHRLEMLRSVKDDLRRMVDEAIRNGGVIVLVVEDWLRRADQLDTEAMRLFEDFDRHRNCMDLSVRYRVSKKARRLTEVVVQLLEDGRFVRVSYPPPPGTKSLVDKGSELPGSQLSVMEKVIEALKDENVNVIGLRGLAGVGKTTLAKHIARQAMEDRLFDEVVIAVVSQVPDARVIQSEIADRLGLRFEEESLMARAGRLYHRLKRQSVLVVLDDLWDNLDLEEIGIPFSADSRGLKVLITTRLRSVCLKMKTQREFFIQPLPEEEAWSFFEKHAGDVVSSSDIKPLATEVARKCGGLPLAILVMARVLKNKSLPSWSSTAQSLKKTTNASVIHDLFPVVFSSLELSYNHLVSGEAKFCFLLCSLFPDNYDIEIEDLFRYGMALKLFGEANTMIEGRIRAYKIVDVLKDDCLLFGSEKMDCVRMNSVVRLSAILIAHRDFMVYTGAGLREWPMGSASEDCCAISLVSNAIHELPDTMMFPKLHTLLLQGNEIQLKRDEPFFTEGNELRVLDLSDMRVPLSLSSLQSLVNLRTLLLNRCKLSNMSVLGELKMLETLSFSGSDIRELPVEIANLACLRLLDLTHCQGLAADSLRIISSLSRLEELYIGKFSLQLESSINLEPISLLDLIRLQSEKPNAVAHLGILSKSQLLVGGSDAVQGPRSQSLDRDTSVGVIEAVQGIESLSTDEDRSFLTTESCILFQLKGINAGLFKLDESGLNDMSSLMIRYHDTAGSYSDPIELLLQVSPDGLELVNLKELFNNLLVVETLSRLKVLEVDLYHEILKGSFRFGFLCSFFTVVQARNMNILMHLFPISVAKRLIELQVLEILDCQLLEQIVWGVQEDLTDEIKFPWLNSLTLKRLPNIRSFCGSYNLEWPFLKRVRVENCLRITTFSLGRMLQEGNQKNDTPLPLFIDNVTFPCLEELYLSHMDNLEEIWIGLQPSGAFSKLNVLELEDCGKLSNLVPSHMIERVQNLEHIVAKNCNSLEEVFNFMGLHYMEENAVFFPQLKELILANLPKLVRIWKSPSKISCFSNLKELTVSKCKSLRSLLSFATVRSLLQLEMIIISECEVLEEIIHTKDEEEEEGEVEKEKEVLLVGQKGAERFMCLRSLKIIRVSCCCRLKNLLPLSIATGLKELQEIRVENCETMESVIGEQGEESAVDKIIFPRLSSLLLDCLPNLFGFCSGIYPIECHSLEILKVVKCPNLNAIASRVLFPLDEEDTLMGIEQFLLMGNYNTNMKYVCLEKVTFYKLEKLYLSQLENLRAIFHGWLPAKSFYGLKILEVYYCNCLKTIFPFAMVGSLLQLEVLKVFKCEMIETILETGDEESTTEVIFPNLKCIILKSLPNLACFSLWNDTFRWPSLEMVRVKGCRKMETFAPGPQIAPKLTAVEVSFIHKLWLGNLNLTIQHHFKQNGWERDGERGKMSEAKARVS